MGLPAMLTDLLDRRTFVTVSTINQDGSPQSSVIWATYDTGTGEVVFSTVLGRRKTRNMERDPRVSICAFDPIDQYKYVEVRGVVTMTTEGGDALIERLSQHYLGRSYVESSPDNVRVVCRMAVTHSFVRGG